MRIHRHGKLPIFLATVYVGVGGGKDDPIRTALTHYFLDLLGRSQIRIRATESRDFVSAPLAHKRLSEHSRGSKNRYAHVEELTRWSLKEYSLTCRSGRCGQLKRIK